jgi:hypothetical protein
VIRKNRIVWKFGWVLEGYEKLGTLNHWIKDRNNKNIIQVNKWVSDKKK